jgi:hypothetical protein
VISGEVTAYLKTFDFSEGFWTKNYHGNEIITQSIDFIREEYFSGWAGIEKEKAQDDLAKYINTDFRKKTISSKQLSLYSNEYLSYERHRSPSLVVIRNLLCFHNEENDELTSLSTLSRYFVTQISNVENSDADNNHYFQMKMAIATFFAVGLRKYAQEIHSNQDIINQDFNYDMYKLLIEISMENSERTECPTLSTVGLIQSKQFTEISRFSTPNHQKSNLATYFDDVELLMERLGRYLRQISLYGYTFPNLSVALHKAELNPEFWEKFWESLNWKRGG